LEREAWLSGKARIVTGEIICAGALKNISAFDGAWRRWANENSGRSIEACCQCAELTDTTVKSHRNTLEAAQRFIYVW
jgi:hypothetical protein